MPIEQPTIEKVAYGGWPNCYRLSNGESELIVTTDVGPRVMRYGFIRGQNVFVEIADQLGRSGEPWWAMRGGHRLWVAPEVKPDTYALDNGAVQASVDNGRISLLQPVEPETGLQKEIAVAYDAADGGVIVTHRISNKGEQTRRLAPWALSQMAKGGTGIVALPARGGHSEQLLPTNPLVMWAYTNFADKRWLFTRKYIVLRQDPAEHSPQKTGLFNVNTRAAYLLGSDLFIKRCQADAAAPYPDFHCSFEIFTNGDFLELETLGPLADLTPGATVEHVERWSLHRDVRLAAVSESEIERVVEPLFSE
jgi:hypothetical protein